MSEIIARPVSGARPTHGQRKATKAAPAAPQLPRQSEGDALALQAAEILQTMFMAAAYNDNEGPRELHNSHLNAVDHLLGLREIQQVSAGRLMIILMRCSKVDHSIKLYPTIGVEVLGQLP